MPDRSTEKLILLYVQIKKIKNSFLNQSKIGFLFSKNAFFPSWASSDK